MLKLTQVKNLTTPQAVLIGAVMIALSIMYSNGAIPLGGVNWKGSGANNNSMPLVTPTPGQLTFGNLPFKGDPNAKVTIVEFADYQCPYCGAVTGLSADNPAIPSLKSKDPNWQAYMPGILKDYVETGKAKLYYRDFAFLGAESNDAANAARCANDQNKFWEYHDKLFASQSGENQGAFSKDKLKGYALQLGLNTAKFNECVDNSTHLSEVTADTTDGNSVGVTGTPSLFINGRMISGAQSYSVVKQAIEEALKN